MTDSVLFIDDEKHILSALKRVFIDENFQVLTASTASDALDILKNNMVSVIVSDNLMPEMKGIEILQKARDISPESVKILMTGHADVQSLIDAINKGEVYRFISKPWNEREIKNTVLHAINHYNMIRSLRNSDEATLLSLAQTIELKDPYTKGHCDRVARYAVATSIAMGLSQEEQRYIRHGSWLHDCGKIGVPEAILNNAGPLTVEQMEVVRNHSRWGAEVARIAHLPDQVVNIILYHHERYDGRGYPCGIKGNDIPVHARIVMIADYFDALSTDRPYRAKLAEEEIKGIILREKNNAFDPDIAETFMLCIMEKKNA